MHCEFGYLLFVKFYGIVNAVNETVYTVDLAETMVVFKLE